MTDQNTQMSRKLSVVVGEANEHVREAIAAMIDEHPELDLVGTASTGDELATLCKDHRPNVAVFDLMACSQADRVDHALRAASPTTVLAVFTARANRQSHARLLEDGIDAVFDKGSVQHLADALHSLAIAIRGEPLLGT